MAYPNVERYSVFISYCRADETIWGVASAVRDQCVAKLQAMVAIRKTLQHLKGTRFEVFFDEHGLPPNGDLDEELQQALEKSFALCIVVGPGYAMSEWCLRELDVFRRRLAARPEALKKRLFVIVVDKEAEEDILKNPRWPVDLLSSTIRNDFCGVSPWAPGKDNYVLPNPPFVEKVDRILRRLVDKIEEAYGKSDEFEHPIGGGGQRPRNGEARVLIESSSEHPNEWQLVEEEIRRAWPENAGNMMCTALTFEGQRTPARNALGESHGVILVYRGNDYDGLDARAALVQRELFRRKSNPARYVAWLTAEPPEKCPDYVWATVPFRDPPRAAGQSRTVSPEKLESLLADIQRVARESSPVAANG